jgi:CRISPR-associated protein Csh1
MWWDEYGRNENCKVLMKSDNILEAIKILGEYETEKEGLDIVDQFIEKAKLNSIKKVICVVFKKNDEKIVYNHAHIEDYKHEDYKKYLYRSHQAKTFDITPTTKIAYNFKSKKLEIEKAFKRIVYWFEKFPPILENKKEKKDANYQQQIEFLKQIKNKILENRDKISRDIYKESEKLKAHKNPKDDEKRNAILTIKVQEKDGNERYIGDYNVFNNTLKEEGLRFTYLRHNVEIKGNGTCNLCGDEKEVSDYTLLKIYSVNKRGFAPEFIQKNAWKRFPICHDCLPYLIAGESFLKNYLKKKFCHGYHFYVIPNFIFGDIDKRLIEEIRRQKKKEEYEGLLIEDDIILNPIKERGDVLNLIFMFCEEIGHSVKVVKYIEDVPPSWIKRLDNALEEMKNLPIFKEESLKKIGVVGKKKSGDLKHIDKRGTTIGGLVEAFFPKSKETGVYSKYFIDIIGDILAQHRINKDLLIGAFMREIRNAHIKEDTWNEKVLVLKSLMLLLFLNKLNLIRE